MTSKQYFVRTFVFVIVFYTFYNLVTQFLVDYEIINIDYILKTVAIGFVVATVLGLINYYTKFNFFTGKRNQ